MKVEIPNSIPQDIKYLPQQQGLELVKLVLWTYPSERVTGFKMYIDQIKAMCDMFETPFDGSGLADPKIVESLWSGATGTVDPAKNGGK
jgi:hypothetical protein